MLIRGLEAVEGTERLARNRFGRALSQLSAYQRKNFLNGPGKVCKALALDRSLNGCDLTGEALHVLDAGERPEPIHAGPRIGIDYAGEAVNFPWRFYL